MTSTLNIAGRLRVNALARPEKPALVHPTRRGKDGRWEYETLTYRAVDALSDAYARGLRRRGIERGTRTILMVPASPELFAIVFALIKIGAVPVVVDPGMGVRRMLHCYAKTQATAFIGVPLAHAIRRLAPRTFASLQIAISPAGLAEKSDELFPIAKTAPDDPLMINFTTGSTGPAKGVVYTHAMADAMCDAVRRTFGHGASDTSLATLPLFAIFDLLLGATSVLPPMDPTKPARADAAAMIDAIERFRATTMFASPAFLRRVGDYARKRRVLLAPLRTVVAGGAPIAPAIVHEFASVLPASARLFATYGATEALPIASIESRDLLAVRDATTIDGRGTCAGAPTDGVSVRVLRIDDGPMDDLAVAAPGEVGELAISGPIVSARYDRDERANALHKIERDGRTWHRTGDLGLVGDDGKIWFCGRKSHRIATKRGALFTVPWEGIFDAHPDVLRTALVGVGPLGEAEPVVCVELRRGVRDRSRVADDLRAMARARGLMLRAVLFRRSFPVDIRHNAKIDREALAAWAARELAGDASALRIVPILGWLFLAYGAFVPLSGVLYALWLVDLFLSVGVHGLQLFVALPRARRAGYSTTATVLLTFLFGATFWRSLGARS